MKHHTEMIEGTKAFTRFDKAMGALLSVSHDELMKRERAYKKKVALNPRKRGPKTKKRSVSLDPAV